jgi:hypothetical protein
VVHLVSKLRTLVDHERVFDLIKVERAQVTVSHNLASFARVNPISFLWLGSGPDVVNQFLEQDRLVTLLKAPFYSKKNLDVLF